MKWDPASYSGEWFSVGVALAKVLWQNALTTEARGRNTDVGRGVVLDRSKRGFRDE